MIEADGSEENVEEVEMAITEVDDFGVMSYCSQAGLVKETVEDEILPLKGSVDSILHGQDFEALGDERIGDNS